MRITLSTLGSLKRYLPEEREIEIMDESLSLKEFIVDSLGIPPAESRLCFIVNGTIQPAHYKPQRNDKIVILKVGGAG